ncbi:MAG: ATP-binding protein [bacterium]
MNTTSIRILLIEDNAGYVRLIEEMLCEAHDITFDLKKADRLSTGIDLVTNENFDMVLLDLSLPDSFGFETFSKIHSLAPMIPTIVLTGFDDESTAVKAVRDGAQDYLVKGQVDANVLVRSVRYAFERNKAEKAIRDSEMKFRALSENSPNMIFISKEGKVIYANKRCEEITGYKRGEFYSPTFDIFFLHPPESREIIKTNFSRHMKGEKIPPFENTIITKKGKRIETIFTTKMINYEGEKAILGIVTDITKLKEAEQVLKRDKESFKKLVNEKTEELLKTQKKLADAKRLSDIGALAATVAHELRNPLAVMQAAVYNIKRKRKNPALDKHLANIEKNIFESNQIINNLLFYSRIKTPHYEVVNIINILNECIASIRERCKTQKISIVKKSKFFQSALVMADPVQMKEMFLNILNNATDALKGVNGTLEIATEYQSEKVISIYFKDNGNGIRKENLQRVYEPFFSTKSKGTGLGLSVCKQIVHLHDGTLHIESEENKGTNVTVSLPLVSHYAIPPDTSNHSL